MYLKNKSLNTTLETRKPYNIYVKIEKKGKSNLKFKQNSCL